MFFEISITYGKNVKDDSSLFIAYIILIPLLVHKLSQLQIKIRLPYKELRSLSTTVYYVHPFLSSVLTLCAPIYGIQKFLAVSLGCVIVYLIKKQCKADLFKRLF